MTANSNTSNDSSLSNGLGESSYLPASDFNLKHRLTGAGLLISLGVIVLPWLLGSYSIDGDDLAVQGESEQFVAQNVDDADDVSIQIEDEEEIKVFVSKIKPVDSKGRQIYEAQKSDVKSTEPASGIASNSTDASNQSDAASVEKVKETLKSALNKKIGEPSKDESKGTTAVKEVPKSKPVAKDKLAPVSKPVEKEEIKQGYIVSVGVYLKRDGAQRVFEDLQKKGFKPSSSESNSSKGLATRVWLGPFSTRAAAGKERSKLEQVIGEKGWIIRYP